MRSTATRSVFAPVFTVLAVSLAACTEPRPPGVLGVAFLSRQHAHGPAFDGLVASANWYAREVRPYRGIALNLTLEDDLELSECWTAINLTDGAINRPRKLDAGTGLSLDRAGASLEMPSWDGTYLAGAPFDFWVGGAAYRLQGPGGEDMGPFEVLTTAPREIRVTIPDLDNPFVLNRSADFFVAWTSSGGAEPVFVNIRQHQSEPFRTHHVVCKFPDVGEGVVPSDWLAGFKSYADGQTLPGASIWVTRRNWVSFKAPGLDGESLFVIEMRDEASSVISDVE